MFERLRSSCRETRVRKALLRHSAAWKQLGEVRLEAVGALYLSGKLESEVEKLEEALIAMDSTYPLSVLEPLVFSKELAYAGLSA